MCLIVFGYRVHPDWELVIAANRDEYHDRPTAPASAWERASEVFGGRDLSQGGSWFAVSKRGRMACVTNVRDTILRDPAAPSRGTLVSAFVRGADPAETFSRDLAARAGAFAGFNLLLWDATGLRHLTNRPQWACREVPPGVHALSNADLDTPWPKAVKARRALEAWLASGGEATPLLEAMADRRPAPDADLPDTGVGLELERLLSPAFIVSPGYGTRSTTLAFLGRDGSAHVTEQRFDPSGASSGRSEARWPPSAP